MLFVFIILMIGMPDLLFGSNGTQTGIVGARPTAMGSAFRGLADDWSALFFNPAGLTQHEGKWSLGGTYGLVTPRASYQAYAYPVSPFSGMHLDERNATEKSFHIPALSIFGRLDEQWALGLGMFTPFGLGTEWDLLSIPEDMGNEEGISKEKEHYSDHQTICVQPTAGFRVSDKISVGLGASYIWGKMALNMVKLPINSFAPGWTAMQQEFGKYGMDIPDLKPNQYRIPVENNLTGEGNGFGVNAGVHMNLSEKFSFGLSARYFSDLRLKGTMTRTQIMQGDLDTYHRLFEVNYSMYANEDDPEGTATKAAILSVFDGKNIVQEYENVEANLPLPLTIGGGVAFKPFPILTMTGDVSWTQWSRWDEIAITSDGNTITTLKQNWKDTLQIGGGVECLAWGDENRQLFIRCGYYTAGTPIPEETMSPTILDTNRRHTIAGGIGFNFGKSSLNLAGEYILFGEREIKDYSFNSETGIAENYAGVYNADAFTFTVGTSIELKQLGRVLYLGKRRPDEGDYAKIVSPSEKALEAEPDDARAHCDMGVAYYKQNNFEKAISCFEKAKSLNPNYSEPYMYLGMIYEKQGDLDKSLNEYSRCYECDPISGVGRRLRARMKVLTRKQLAEEAQKSTPVASIPENTVAVLYFRNSSGVAEWAPLQKGLAKLLISDLAQIKSIRVIEPLRLQLLMEELKIGMYDIMDESTAPRMGKLLGAGRIINGAIASPEGKRIRLDALYTEVEMDRMLEQRAVQGTVDKFFTLEKKLVFKIVDSMGITLTQEEKDAISKVPTESFAAFLAYCRGLDYDDRGMYEKAEAEFQRAAQIDPNFIQLSW